MTCVLRLLPWPSRSFNLRGLFPLYPWVEVSSRLPNLGLLADNPFLLADVVERRDAWKVC
jgi:hypothetical protein